MIEKALRALRASEELHRATLSAISDAVFLTDDAGTLTYICPNVNVIFGYAPHEVRKLVRIDRLLGENLYDRGELATRGEIQNIERDISTRFGERRVLIHVKAVSIDGGTVLYTCRDITELSRTQEALRLANEELAHTSRLSMAGQLMASITHEVSQPLTAIHTNVEVALAMLGSAQETEEMRDVLNEIRVAVQSASEILRRARALVRKRVHDPEILDLNKITSDTLRLLAGEVLNRRVTLSTELAPSLPAVEGDPVSIQQVLLNLIMNAMDAMDGLQEQTRRLSVGTRHAGDSVEIVVRDNGCGVPTESLQDIFEPFFTTKKEGIGLGLVITQSIVDQHNGEMWVESAVHEGASFHVSFPSKRA